ncbi:MAG: hypothetical protein NC305_11880 [Lachnospiraceae bacterium]|nr:hypothetical protein [Butyrivibrio sp.]MCM1343601.1 hypothetical protein [Muribaculaceae bacterium]MCM1411230.1 hypothetical protein [Lachnospiraceae bacterium]
MKVPEDLLMKFPVIFRNKLESGEIVLQDEVKFEYEPVWAFRCIDRKAADTTDVSRNDFRSNAELGRTNFKGKIEHPELLPEYYGVSFYRKREELDVRLGLPRKNRKVVEGYIRQEGGPQLQSGKTSHVCWWLYENADVSSFSIVDQ